MSVVVQPQQRYNSSYIFRMAISAHAEFSP